MIVIIHILSIISSPVNGINKQNTLDNDLIRIFVVNANSP